MNDLPSDCAKVTLGLVLLGILLQSPRTISAEIKTLQGNTLWPIPGTIEAEDFDPGGEGVGYHDVDATNNGGQYRLSEGVDIEITPDGSGSQYQVGWAKAGEWLNYTVYVTTTGIYTMTLRAGAVNGGTGGKVHIELDGVNVSGPINIVNGVWLGYSTITVPNIPLTAGQHILKLALDTN